jgi:beta-glucosidase
MPSTTYNFPRGFLWGTATSSHQVEGNNKNNNFWAWEQEPGRIAEGHRSGLACDWWGGRWREDFDRIKETHQNAHRFSIEWSRVQPAPTRWDDDALDQYRQMLQRLYEFNITPLITLHHFCDPVWVSELGGWENDSIVDLFAAYVEKTVEALSEYNNLWVTINEPNVLAVFANLLGLFPPGKQDIRLLGKVYRNLIRAHSAAYKIIHRLQPEARVGIATNYRSAAPSKSWNPFDRTMVGLIHSVFNNAVPKALRDGVLRLPWSRTRIPEAKKTQDFLGLNYYTRDKVAFSLLYAKEAFMHTYFPPGRELSTTGYIANEPEGIFEAMKWGLQFKIPMIITENGVEDQDDRMRPNYLIQHLHQVWRAVNFNWPIKGYFYWTLVDNFEWERGWTQRFGLWELEINSQARRRRPSVDLFAEICRYNEISSDLVKKYAPESFDLLYPGL